MCASPFSSTKRERLPLLCHRDPVERQLGPCCAGPVPRWPGSLAYGLSARRVSFRGAPGGLGTLLGFCLRFSARRDLASLPACLAAARPSQGEDHFSLVFTDTRGPCSPAQLWPPVLSQRMRVVWGRGPQGAGRHGPVFEDDSASSGARTRLAGGGGGLEPAGSPCWVPRGRPLERRVCGASPDLHGAASGPPCASRPRRLPASPQAQLRFCARRGRNSEPAERWGRCLQRTGHRRGETEWEYKAQ